MTYRPRISTNHTKQLVPTPHTHNFSPIKRTDTDGFQWRLLWTFQGLNYYVLKWISEALKALYVYQVELDFFCCTQIDKIHLYILLNLNRNVLYLHDKHVLGIFMCTPWIKLSPSDFSALCTNVIAVLLINPLQTKNLYPPRWEKTLFKCMCSLFLFHDRQLNCYCLMVSDILCFFV